ncbi:MAG TPA: hypothetical protein VN803_08855 [Gemmatimonadales bacterium]|nr:hypothetical protein [Gemmatimonadales bacterium]
MDTTQRSLVVAAALLLAACSSTEPNAMHRVTVSAATASATVHAPPGFNADLIVGDEAGSVSISSAQIVLSRIKLHDDVCVDDEDEGEDADTLDDASDAPAVVSHDTTDDEHGDGEGENDDEEDGDDDDDCPPLTVGPVLVDLPLDGTTTVVLDALVPAGTYQRLQARLHAVKPGDEGVGDFLTAHPEFEGISVKVVGVFTDADGVDHEFTLTSPMNVVSAVNFDEPVTVDAGTTNLTIDVDVGSWFTSAAGGVIDPTKDANQRAIERNIRRSLRAFEDDDHDGDEDEP